MAAVMSDLQRDYPAATTLGICLLTDVTNTVPHVLRIPKSTGKVFTFKR